MKQSDEVKARNAEVAAAYKAAQSAHRKMVAAMARHAKTLIADRAAEQSHKVAVEVYREAKTDLDELTERTTGTEAPATASD